MEVEVNVLQLETESAVTYSDVISSGGFLFELNYETTLDHPKRVLFFYSFNHDA